MRSIHDIVLLLNDSLTGLFSSKRLSGSALYGIAEAVKRNTETLPELDEKYVGIDDIHPAIIYHKLNAMTSSIKPATGYGRGVGDHANTYSISAVVFLDRGKTGLYPDELLLMIQANFPEQIRLDPYKSIRVAFGSVVLNSSQVYQQEYTSDTYRLKANQYLFKINYTVEAVFSKNCFDKCPD
jgi:hypothetical protein